MNLFLHGVEPHIYLGDTIYEPDRGERYDVVLTNPPFGTKGANQAPDRDDFTIETSNKQLNFVQHVLTIAQARRTRRDGAAGQLPVRGQGRRGLRDPHAGLQPAHRPAPAARHVHALQPGREGQRHLLPERPAHRSTSGFSTPAPTCPASPRKTARSPPQHFAEFEKCYGKDPNGLSKRKDLGETGRFRKFHISEIKERGYKLDITWLKDESLEDSDELPEPQDLAAEAITELEAVVDDLQRNRRVAGKGGRRGEMTLLGFLAI